MTKFIKKPAAIEAYQITKELLMPILFDGEDYPRGLSLGRSETYPPEREIRDWSGNITTIHGQKTRVIIGDWIITEPDGEHFYPCKPDIFKETYFTEEEYAALET